MKTTHFKDSVPQEIQAKLLELAENIQSEGSSMVNKSCFDSFGDWQLELIHGKHISGFIPFQDGGYHVTNLVRNDMDESYHLTEKQTDFMREQAVSCWKAFLLDNDLEEDTSYSSLTNEQKEKLSNYENEWFEPALLSFTMFADKTSNGWDHVVLRTSINYKDAPYYQEKSEEDIKSFSLGFDEFLAEPIESLINKLKV